MSKYFEFYSTTNDPELNFIRVHLDKLGELHCTNKELEHLWCEFSDKEYSAQFMIPDIDLVSEFAVWLSKYGEEEDDG